MSPKGSWCGAAVLAVALAVGCAPVAYRAPAPAMVPVVPVVPELPEPRAVLYQAPPSATLDPFQLKIALPEGCPKLAQPSVTDQATVDPFCFTSPPPRCDASGPATAGDDAIIDPFCGSGDNGG